MCQNKLFALLFLHCHYTFVMQSLQYHISNVMTSTHLSQIYHYPVLDIADERETNVRV